MITLINNTGYPFAVEVGDQRKNNTKLTVMYGKRMSTDIYVPTGMVKSVQDAFLEKSKEEINRRFNLKTRLYYSNKDYKPIVVSSDTKCANFLFLAHKLEKEERVLRVTYDGVFGLDKAFSKGNFLSAVCSFRTDRESSFTIITINGENIVETKYSCVDNKIKVSTVGFKADRYKKYDIKNRGTITPYKPRKPTHLVFALDADYNAAKDALGKNHTVIAVNSRKTLLDEINKYKEFGFTAASIYTPVDHGEEVTPAMSAYLKVIIDSFKTVHQVYADGKTEFISLKPKPKPRYVKPRTNNRPAHKNNNKPGQKISNTYAKAK